MSKEIKERCKECMYYNDEIEYPDVNGTTTHSNCMSRKCEYRKETKDLKIRRLTSKVSDLEAKLADKEETIKELNDKVLWLRKWLKMADDLNGSLKQQLAEKDVDLSLARNEIETLKHNLKVAQEHDNVMSKQYFEKCKKANQDKISFAVEKLTEVKKLIENKLVEFDDIEMKIIMGLFAFNITCQIDNQIKSIKEGK